MKKLLYTILLMTGVVAVSCTSSLDLKPVSEISVNSFWKTEEDAKGGLNGMYVRLRSQAQANLFLWGESRSEVFDFGIEGAANMQRYFQNTLDPVFSGPTWVGLYTIVHDANLILKYVPQITFTSEAEKKKILAQAHAMRAFVYFVMARTWGGVPLVTEPTEGYDPTATRKARSTVEEIFKLIKEDIEKALELFPDNAFIGARSFWAKPAVNALKGDVYLWTAKKLSGGEGDYNIALAALEDIKTADVQLLPNFADVFANNNKGNKEILMAVRFQDIEAANNNYSTMYIRDDQIPATTDAATKALIQTGGGSNNWAPSAVFRSQFTADDLRKNTSFVEIYTYNGNVATYYGTVTLKFKGFVQTGIRKFLDDVILYRYADVLLMKAEAKNGLGQDPSTEMNDIRRRAYGPAYNNHVFVNGTKAENDEAILKERLFELVFEGKRWWDLVRFNKAFEKVPSLAGRSNKPGLMLFPIAESTISLNSAIIQNQDY